MTTDQPIDVAIIGGGPAGYAAAIYAARFNLTTTVIEQGMSGGQIATTNEVENYPGIPLLSGAELGERFQQPAEGLGAQVAWYRLRCRCSAVYGASRYGRYAGLERYRLHGCHAAICWFCWRGYVSRSWRFILRNM